MNCLDNYKAIKEEVSKLQSKSNIIVVTKNRSFDIILPIIRSGQVHFGENKVQEAKEKWVNFLNLNKDIKLHLIGKLQSNKAKDAFGLFDFIHTLDSEKLAKKFCLTGESHEIDNIGLMCIPPINLDPRPFFEKMQQFKIDNDLKELSMGMSSDYKEALHYGSTYLRIGSAIFK